MTLLQKVQTGDDEGQKEKEQIGLGDRLDITKIWSNFQVPDEGGQR